MTHLTELDITLHFIIFLVSLTAPAFLVLAYGRTKKDKKAKEILGALAISFIFGALRWTGGSIASMDIPPFTDIAAHPLYVPVWTACGLLAAAFGIYSSLLVIKYME